MIHYNNNSKQLKIKGLKIFFYNTKKSMKNYSNVVNLQIITKRYFMTHLKEGMHAPCFEGIDQNGNNIKLTDFSGNKLVLYFYPKDNTPGCTAEACNLRDNYTLLQSQGYKILGVNPGSIKSHKNFTDKYALPFPLIADISKQISTDYGVWQEKKLYGKTFMGIVRTTFIIDENGIIEEIISKVDTKNHSQQIMNEK